MKVCDKCKCSMIPTINYINGNSVIEYHCPVCNEKQNEKEKKENNGKECEKS